MYGLPGFVDGLIRFDKIGLFLTTCTVAVNSVSEPADFAVGYTALLHLGTSKEATALPASEVDACTSGIHLLFVS